MELGEKKHHAGCRANIALRNGSGEHEVSFVEHLGQVVDGYLVQRAKIGGVTDQIVADGQQLSKSHKEVAANVADCLLLDHPNREWLHKTLDEKSLEVTGFAHRTIDHLIEISAMLTSEQRVGLKKRIDSAHGEK